MPAAVIHGKPRRPPLSREVLAFTLVVLLALPIGLGLALGWYGMNPSAAEGWTPVAGDAHLYLNNFPDSKLVVEFDYASGLAPPASAVSILEQRINSTTGKGTVQVVEYPMTTSASSYSVSDLLALERQVRHVWPSWGTMSVCYLLVPGTYSDDYSVLGLAYQGSSVAVFSDVIQSNAPGQYSNIMATVMVHEFGHEMGLVGLVGSAPNEDPQHPGHSTDPNDVMYWQVETTSIFGGLLGGSATPNQFDVADLVDLSTVRATPIAGEVIPYIALLFDLIGFLALAIVVVRQRRPRKSPAPAGSPPSPGPQGPGYPAPPPSSRS